MCFNLLIISYLMVTFTIKRHIEIDENYQGINLTEFSIKADDGMNNDQIADTFIQSTHYSVESLRDIIKDNGENIPYLRRAFNIDKINIADLKKLSQEKITKYLLDYINEPDWGEDRNEFAKLLDKYFEIHNELEDNFFYLISKDWFNKGDERVIEPENSVYIYYFLIVYLDKNSKILILTE